MALLGRGVLEDIAEEITFVSSLLEPFILLLSFLWVSSNRSRTLNNPHASSSLGPRSQILHVFKDLKHAIIGYIVLCPIGLSFFFFLMFQNIVLW